MTMHLVSAVSIISNVSMISYAYSWAGASPVGAIIVEVSNDYSKNADGTVRNPGTWTQITFNVNGTPSNSAPVTGSLGTGFIDIDSVAAYAIRTSYFSVSGTGTLQAVVNGKAQ